MRILVVANQRPLPTFHGANADNWRIIRALQGAHVDVACISWRDWIADDAYLAELIASVPQYLEFPLAYHRPVGARESRRLPEFATMRRLDAAGIESAIDFGTRFDPDCVVLLGLYGGELALDLAAKLGRPLVYRSHAIETQYHEEYLRLRRSSEPTRYTWAQSCRDASQLRAISRFEQLVVSRSALTLEISADDLHARQRSALLPVAHFPPLVSSPRAVEPVRRDTYDVCYVGNFFMPNNKHGIVWFVREVLPIVLDRTGPLRVVIVGKSTDRGFDQVIESYGVEVTPNPTDVDEIIASSIVGVNPIFTGNGTTLKTLDYLWSGCGVVTTPIGVQGFRFGDSTLPLTVAGSRESFADSIVRRLADRQSLHDARAKLRRFTWEDAGPRLASMIRDVA